MDLYQLRTFVAVAREGSITRASEVVHLSQPAVSAHVKEIEDALGLTLFERTSRGMTLTADGRRLLGRAEQTLAAHRALMEEAARSKEDLTGTLRLGVGSNSDHAAIGRLLTTMSERFPRVEVTLRHARSVEILAGLRNDAFDAGLYNEGGEPDRELATIEVSRFEVFLAAAKGTVDPSRPLDWKALAAAPWIYPPAAACCGRAAEGLFLAHGIRPARVVGVDTQPMIRTLVASGLGVGLLHADTAAQARAAGEVELLCEAAAPVRVLFAHLSSRTGDPVLSAAAAIVRSATRA
ncbi:MAG: LysR family transcriptional regulator [Anaeromyxobacter sp.]